MTKGNVARVLAKLAAFDQRTVGEVDVEAWNVVIGHLELRDCLEAVEQHYRQQSERAWPADIRKQAEAIRDQREARERQAERRLAIEAGPTTADRSAEVTALVQSVAASLPKVDPQEKAIARARRERGWVKSEPKRKRRQNKPPKDFPDPATEDAAALARRYLRDGYTPAQVSERLAISKRWCERVSRRTPEAS